MESQTLENKLQALESELRTKKTEIVRYQAQARIAKDVADACRQDAKESDSRKRECEHQMKEMTSRLEMQQEECKKLGDELEKCNMGRLNLEEQLKNAMAELESEKHRSEELVQKLEKKLEATSNELESAKVEYAQKDEEIKAIKHSLSAESQHRQSLEIENSKLQTELKNAQEKLSSEQELAQQIEKAVTEKMDAENVAKELKHDKERLEEKFREFQVVAEALRSETENLKPEIAKLQLENQNLVEERNGLKNEVEEFQKCVESLKREVKSVRQSGQDERDAEICHLKQKIDGMEQQNKTATDDSVQRIAELERSLAASRENEKTISEKLDLECQSKQELLDQLKCELGMAQENFEKISEKFRECVEAEDSVSSMALENLQNEISKLQRNVNEKEKEIVRLEAEKSILEKQTRDIQNEFLSKFQKEMENFKIQVFRGNLKPENDGSEVVAKLRIELEQKRTEVEGLRRRLEETELQLVEAQKELDQMRVQSTATCAEPEINKPLSPQPSQNQHAPNLEEQGQQIADVEPENSSHVSTKKSQHELGGEMTSQQPSGDVSVDDMHTPAPQSLLLGFDSVIASLTSSITMLRS